MENKRLQNNNILVFVVLLDAREIMLNEHRMKESQQQTICALAI